MSELASVPALSPRRGSRTAGKPAPPSAWADGLVSRHPADVAADKFEVRFVAERRSRTPPMPWSQIAKQLGGRTELDLRRTYDPDFGRSSAPAHAVPVGAAAPARPRAAPILREHSVGVRPGTREDQVLAIIARGMASRVEIAEALPTTVGCVDNLASILRRKGMITHPPGLSGWELTVAGSAEVLRLRGFARSFCSIVRLTDG